MEHKKCRFAEGACGKAKLSLASALKIHYIFAIALLAAGAAVYFAGIELFEPAFADQSSVAAVSDASNTQVPSGNSYYRSVSESMSIVASHGSGSNSPTSYHRSMTESMSVTTVQGKAPNSYSRSMSEQASLTTGMPPSAPSASQPARAAPAPYSAGSNQRIDERFSPTFKILNKREDTTKNVIGGTPFLAAESIGAVKTGSSDHFSETGEVSDQDSPADNSMFLRQLDAAAEYILMQKSAENAALANLSTSAVLLLGTAAVVVTRNPAVSSGRLQNKICVFLLLKPKAVPDENAVAQKTPAPIRIFLLVLVVFTSASVANSVEPIAGQAFADQSAGIAYKTGATGGLAYREWNSAATSWGSEVSLTTAGTEISVVKFLYSPTSQFRVIGVLKTNGEIDIYYCESVCTSAGNWVGPTLVADMGAPTAPRRYFDMAFEGSSGDLLIAYDKTTTETNDFFYQTFDYETLTLSGESGFDYVSDTTTDNDIRFFKMASKPSSDEIAMILLDATRSDTFAFVWDGSNFGNQLTVTTGAGGAAIAAESIGVAYETSSGAAVVFSSDNTGGTDLKGAFARWTGSWSGPTRYDINPVVSGTTLPVWYTVKANPDSSSNQVMACNVDNTNLDLSCILVTAGSAGTNSQIDGAIGATTSRMFDFSWDPSSNNGIVLFEDATGATSIKFRTWDGSSWAAEQSITLANNAARWLVGATDTAGDTTGVDSLWAYYEDTTTDDIGDGEWERTSSTATFTDNGDTTITANAGATITHEVVAIAFRRTAVIPRTISESLGMSETADRVFTGSRSLSEQLVVTESIAKTTSDLLSDSLAMTESATGSIAASRSMSEQMAMTEMVVIHAGKPLTEQLVMTETVARVTVAGRTLTEQMSLTETVSIAIGKQLNEQLTATDTLMRSTAVARTMGEPLAMTENLAKSVSKSLSEQLALTESATSSIMITRAVSDNLALSDTTLGSPIVFVIISDSMSIADSFADIALLVHLDLGEPLVLAQSFATNFSASFNQVDSEGIIIGDSVVLSLVPSGQVFNRDITESMSIQDSLTILIVIPPPPPPPVITTMPNLMMTQTEDLDEYDGLTDPAEAVEVDGIWNVDSLDEQNLQSLIGAIGMPVYDVDLEAISADIDDLTMILPTFEVSMNVSDQPSDDGMFLTPTLSNLPAGLQVIIPIDVQASMNGAGNLDHIGNMIVWFTPAESAGNSTILITLLDNSPEATADGLPADMAAFYVDVSIVGDFGVITPDNSAFFEEQPEITFTITEEWAQTQDTDRDLNNVPIIGLFLLDESTGDWIEISSENIEPPTSAVGGVYMYTASLPHFSTYLFTADEDRGFGGGRSSSEFTASLTESLFVTSAMNTGAPIASEGKIVFKDIVDSLTLRAEQPQPLHQRVITIHDITVAISIADIRSAATFGTAFAALNFEIDNKGSTAEELVLRFWYSDPAGKMVYEAEQTITIGAGESILEEVKIPFSSPGLYNVMIEVESDDGTLSTTDIAVNVPWLTVYLYILIVIAIAVVVASIAYVIYAMRRSGLSIVGDK